MKNDNKTLLKEKFVEMYLQGKTMQEISKLTGWSRNFVGKLIKNDPRIKQYRNNKIIKLYKGKNQHRINATISVEFWEKIGVSRDPNIEEFVNIIVDENNSVITIKKI